MTAPNPAASPSPAMDAALARLGADTVERKRSVVLAGHRTSVSVEPLFWNELRSVANARDISLNALVAEIDGHAAGSGSLSSALRVFALVRARDGG